MAKTPKNIKKYVLQLVENVNKSKRRIKRDLYPLEPVDDGWRFVFDKYLEDFTFLPSGRKLLEMAIYDLDFQGGYYWIPYDEPPRGVTTPAMRLMHLLGEGKEDG